MYRRVSATTIGPASPADDDIEFDPNGGIAEGRVNGEEIIRGAAGNRSTRDGNYVSYKSHYYCRVANDDDEDEYLM